jgi:hypothetical protein
MYPILIDILGDWFTYFFLDILQFQLFWNNDFIIMISNIIVYSEYRLQKWENQMVSVIFVKMK